jgi:DHA1 family inner membrane transport protein
MKTASMTWTIGASSSSASSGASTLAIAVNASGYQFAAAFAAWLGDRVVDSGLGLRSIYLAGAVITVAGLLVA